MKNRLIAFLVTFACLIQSGVQAAEVAAREQFNLDVGMLSEKQIKNLGQNFTKVDLKRFVNRDIKDEVEGDNKGGWSDQGENDLRMFNAFGNQEMLGVPFYFIDPAQNGNKAVLGLRGQNDSGLPTSVEIPVNKTTAGAYFIQASPWCSGTCGTYTWVYEDGSESFINIVQNEHICDFWGKSSYDFVRPAWTATKADGSLRTLYLFALNNPHPEKPVKNLRLESTGGGAYIMIMAITLTDQGPYLTKTASAESITTTTFGWYEYTQPDDDMRAGTALDFSVYLDAPAGKHGAITSDGEKLVFEDKTEAKFWGADIIGSAVFPDKEQAQKTSKRLALSGINLVRLSGFDEAVLGESDRSDKPDSEKMDRLSYFISELKSRGIYVYISLLSKRELRSGDGIEGFEKYKEGYGIDAYFDEQLIELQKNFIHDFMSYKSSYTGLTIAEEPAVCFIELIDSLSVFDYNRGYGRSGVSNEDQYKKIRAEFNEFLASKYKTTEQLKKAWTSDYDKAPYENLEEKSIELKAMSAHPFVSDGYKADVNEYLGEAAEEYYNQLKQTLGSCMALVTLNSNIAGKTSMNDCLLNTKSDFVIRSFFNAAPLSKTDKISINSVFSQYGSMTKNAENMIRSFSGNTPAQKPYIVNWGSAMPNLYYSEGYVMIAAFSGEKNWSAICHSFVNEDYPNKNYISDFYSMYNNPVSLALAPVAASIFYSAEPQKSEELELSSEDVKKGTVGAGVLTAEQAFKKNIRLSFTELSQSSKKNTSSSAKTIKTDKIFWDTTLGIFEVRGDTTEAVSGFLTSREELPSFVIEVDNSFVTAALTAIDKKSIKESERYLVTAVGTNQNYKSRVNLIRNRYDLLGEEKIVVETITGAFTLKRTGNFEVFALGSSGERISQIGTSKDKNGYLTFNLLSENKAVQYEIVKK